MVVAPLNPVTTPRPKGPEPTPSPKWIDDDGVVPAADSASPAEIPPPADPAPVRSQPAPLNPAPPVRMAPRAAEAGWRASEVSSELTVVSVTPPASTAPPSPAPLDTPVTMFREPPALGRADRAEAAMGESPPSTEASLRASAKGRLIIDERPPTFQAQPPAARSNAHPAPGGPPDLDIQPAPSPALPKTSDPRPPPAIRIGTVEVRTSPPAPAPVPKPLPLAPTPPRIEPPRPGYAWRTGLSQS